jgi:hypothetical protein
VQLQVDYTHSPDLVAKRVGFRRVHGYFGFQFTWGHLALFVVFHWRKPWSAAFRKTPW